MTLNNPLCYTHNINIEKITTDNYKIEIFKIT